MLFALFIPLQRVESAGFHLLIYSSIHGFSKVLKQLCKVAGLCKRQAGFVRVFWSSTHSLTPPPPTSNTSRQSAKCQQPPLFSQDAVRVELVEVAAWLISGARFKVQ